MNEQHYHHSTAENEDEFELRRASIKAQFNNIFSSSKTVKEIEFLKQKDRFYEYYEKYTAASSHQTVSQHRESAGGSEEG